MPNFISETQIEQALYRFPSCKGGDEGVGVEGWTLCVRYRFAAAKWEREFYLALLK
jgi:hypothetical protein